MPNGYVEPGSLVYCDNCGCPLSPGASYPNPSEPLCSSCQIKK